MKQTISVVQFGGQLDFVLCLKRTYDKFVIIIMATEQQQQNKDRRRHVNEHWTMKTDKNNVKTRIILHIYNIYVSFEYCYYISRLVSPSFTTYRHDLRAKCIQHTPGRIAYTLQSTLLYSTSVYDVEIAMLVIFVRTFYCGSA